MPSIVEHWQFLKVSLMLKVHIYLVNEEMSSSPADLFSIQAVDCSIQHSLCYF
jgi:hypothetical protein